MPAPAPSAAKVDPAAEAVNVHNGDAAPSEFEQLATFRRPSSRVPASVTFLGNTVNSAARFAKIIFESGNAGRGVPNAQTVFLKIMRGLELGLGPMEALAELHVVNGKVGCSGKLLLKKVRESGIRHKWIKSDATIAELEFVTPDGEVFHETYTIEEAAAAGLLAKKDSIYLLYPKDMLRWRCMSRITNQNCPEVVGGGMLLAEELGASVDAFGNIMALPVEAPRPARPNGEAKKPAAAAAPSEMDRAAADGGEGPAGDMDVVGDELGGAAAPTGAVPATPTPDPADAPAEGAAHRLVSRQSTAAPGMVSMIRRMAIEAALWNKSEATVCLAGQLAATVGLEADWYTPTYLAEQVNAEEIVRELKAIADERKARQADDDDDGSAPQLTLT